MAQMDGRTGKGRLLPLVRKLYDEDLLTASEILIRRRSRWLGLYIQGITLSGECVAVGDMSSLWDHGQRLIHLYVLWGYYKSIYLDNVDELVKVPEIQLRIKSLGTKMSARVVDSLLKNGVDEGIWTVDTPNGQKSKRHVIPTSSLVRIDGCAGLFGFVNDYPHRNVAEQKTLLEFWCDELGYSEKSLLTLSDFATRNQSRPSASI